MGRSGYDGRSSVWRIFFGLSFLIFFGLSFLIGAVGGVIFLSCTADVPTTSSSGADGPRTGKLEKNKKKK
jgi:hypothetical protein